MNAGACNRSRLATQRVCSVGARSPDPRERPKVCSSSATTTRSFVSGRPAVRPGGRVVRPGHNGSMLPDLTGEDSRSKKPPTLRGGGTSAVRDSVNGGNSQLD